MKVFVCEYCCCQPLHAGATAQALRTEGLAMLSALMTDLVPVPDVEPIALLAEDMPRVAFPCRRVKPATEKQTFGELAASSDWTIVIAPETDGILEERCSWVIEADGKILGPSIDAVRLTADKLALASVFRANRVPTPETIRLAERESAIEDKFLPGVCKPRFGAGSMSTYRVNSIEELERIREAEPGVEFILQKLVHGTPASVAFLIAPQQRIALLPAEQTLSRDGRFRYLGGRLPLRTPLAERARRLALKAVKAVPGLFGYVGVDLVLGPTRGHVIEINPRLTTSYVGLRALARPNLAAALLHLARGLRMRLTWRTGTVRWRTDGDATFE